MFGIRTLSARMTGRRSSGLFRVALVAGAVIALVAVEAQAQGRDRALDSVLALTTQLIERTEAPETSDSQIWAGVQALTDALRRFALSETETRADEKITSPPVASLRPGQTETTAVIGDPGPEIPIADVPRDWFNARITDAQTALNGARVAVEQGAPRLAVADHLLKVRSALAIVDRPPAR